MLTRVPSLFTSAANFKAMFARILFSTIKIIHDSLLLRIKREKKIDKNPIKCKIVVGNFIKCYALFAP